MILGSTHTGRVVDVDDPEKLYRIRVELLGLFDGELPFWIRPAVQPVGILWSPRVDDLVDVELEQEDDTNDILPGEHFFDGPNYRYYPYGHTAAQKIHPIFKENYPERRGLVSREGHCLYFDDVKDAKKRYVGIAHAKGHQILLHPDGTISLHATDGTTLQVSAGGTVTASVPGGCALSLSKTAATLISPAGAYVSVQDAVMEVVHPIAVNVTAPLVNLSAAQVNMGAGAATGDPAPLSRPVTGSCVARYDELKTMMDTMSDRIDDHGHPPGTFVTATGGPVTGTCGKASDIAASVDPGNLGGAFPVLPETCASTSRCE